MEIKSNAPKLRELYLQAIDIEDTTERALFLAQACDGDLETLRQVEKLLAAAEGSVQPFLQKAVIVSGQNPGNDDFETVQTNLSNPPGLGVPSTLAEPLQDVINISQHPMIGPYKLLEEIGHGGMGTVYMAQQTEPVKRKVALKVIRPGMWSKEVIARFEAERQALAMMDHPNIARVLDGGTVGDARSSAGERGRGLPFFVMELVRGVPMTQFCSHKKLELRERLELFVDVCKAVQHAHQKGIIHRDLKPSNIMITLHDGKPVVKVIDFGVAKALNQKLTEQTLFTQYLQMIGTPVYMAPEQAEMSGLDVDTRSDIYSLGVVLYELLTGTTPFDRNSLSSLGIDGIRKLIKEQEPPRPSARLGTLRTANLSTVDNQRILDSEDITKQLKRDLDWIVMKALEKDRERRYESANAFAADVQRYLNDEPVEACPPTVVYRLKKYAKKHKAWLTTAAFLIAMLITATAVSTVFAYRANQARVDAEKSEQDAIDAQKQSQENFKAAVAAIDKLLEHASSPALQEAPGLQPMRLKMLDDVLTLYDGFKSTTEDSDQLEFRSACLLTTLGVLANNLGKRERARECHDEALRQITSLVGETPTNLDYRHTRIDVLLNNGYFYNENHASRDYARSIGFFEEARREIEKLRNESQADGFPPINQHLLIKKEVASLFGAGFVARLNGDDEMFIASTREGYRLAKQHDIQHAELEEAMAVIEKSKNAQAAAKHFEESIEQWTQIVAERPTRQNKILLAKTLGSAAEFFQSRDPMRARQYLDRAITLAEENYQKFPSFDIYGSMMWMLIAQRVRLERPFDQETINSKYRKYDRYFSLEPISIEHVSNRIDAQVQLRNYSQVLADLESTAKNKPHWKISFTRMSRHFADFPIELQDKILKIADQYVEADPDVVDSRKSRASILLAIGRKDDALRDLEIIVSRDPSQYYLAYQASLLSLHKNDHSGYRRFCLNLLNDFAGSAADHRSHIVVWTCALAPDALDDYKSAIKFAQHAVEKDPNNQQQLIDLGAILMRAGRYDEAKKQLQKALETGEDDKTSLSYINYFLAMTEHHLSNTDAAKDRLNQANESAGEELTNSPVSNRKLALELLRNEAEALIFPDE